MIKDLYHGGALDQMRKAFPGALEPWVDLSTGINPWPYPNTGADPAALHRLPIRTDYEDCRAAMAEAIKAPKASLLLAPGSELLIRLLPTVIAPKRVAILNPTYGDHAEVWRASDADMIETSSPLDYTGKVDAVILCNPNNPDGRTFDRDTLCQARETLAQRGGYLIIDEAYADLAPGVSLAHMGGAEGLIILRSTGKFFGLAGLRLGALVAPDRVLSAMIKHLGTWPVSGPALEIGARAYSDTDWHSTTRERLARARHGLDQILTQTGLTICGGTDLFRYVRAQYAHELWQHLARAGLYIRRFPWSDQHLRIGLPPDAEAEARLAAALTLSA